MGRRGRNHALAVYDFLQGAGGVTRVELTTSRRAGHRDRPAEAGGRGGLDSAPHEEGARTAATDLEEPSGEPLKRVTIAGYEPATAPRFGAHPGMDPLQVSQPKA